MKRKHDAMVHESTAADITAAKRPLDTGTSPQTLHGQDLATE